MVEQITTGVDKLVDLVKFKKKIGFREAAQELGVSRKVVADWADFLEDENVISIEYFFLKPYLIEKKLSKTEIKRKIREFTIKKEAFLRKVESTLKNLDRDNVTIQKFNHSFYKLKKQVSAEIKGVKEHLTELEKYELMKKDLDSQLLKVKSDFEKHSRAVDDRLRGELSSHKKLARLLKSSNIKDKARVQHLAEHEKEQILSLIDMARKKEVQIKDKEKAILKKLNAEKHVGGTSKAKEQIVSKFQAFFDKKNRINRLLQEIAFEKDELKRGILSLLEKAKGIEMKAGYEKSIKDFTAQYDKLDKKRIAMKSKMLELDRML